MTPPPPPVPPREAGMILINVLLFVAIAAGIVALMIGREDGALHRTQRLRDAARAQAVARGGELSAITALRRDGIAAPLRDTPIEPWGALAEQDVAIEGGRFDLAIADAQARFNINMLARGDAIATATLARIAEAVGQPPEIALQVAAYLQATGPIADLTPLRLAGLPPETLARLSTLITALPFESRINVNTIGEDLLAILMNDPAAARRMIDLRTRQGFLRPEDFSTLSAALPAGTGFTSDQYWVRTRVTIGDTSQQLTTLLTRRRTPEGAVTVTPAARWRGPDAPDQAPAL